MRRFRLRPRVRITGIAAKSAAAVRVETGAMIRNGSEAQPTATAATPTIIVCSVNLAWMPTEGKSLTPGRHVEKIAAMAQSDFPLIPRDSVIGRFDAPW